MYNNADHAQVGQDYYNLKTGEYVLTVTFTGDEDKRLHVDGVPSEVKSNYGDYMNEVYGYVKGSNKVLTEDDFYDHFYSDILVSKERLDAINAAKQVLINVWEESGIREPFVYEDGEFSVGKEQVLSAHINAGFEHGWITSSICW